MIEKKRINALAVLMCGGKSRRMNAKPKQFLDYEGRTFLVQIAEQLSSFEDIVLSCNTKIEPYQNVCDKTLGQGPIGGIASVLWKTDKDLVFVVACDMPLITTGFIGFLFERWEEAEKAGADYDCLVPVAKGQKQPLCAIYRKRILPLVEEQIREKNYRLQALLQRLSVYYLEVPESLEQNLRNVNTPEEYKKILERVSSSKVETTKEHRNMWDVQNVVSQIAYLESRK